jgi:hypothetical protein
VLTGTALLKNAGKIGLHDLKLKKNAVDKLGLPIQVIDGHLNSFKVSWSWTKLGTEPMVIELDGLHVLLGPSNQHEWDDEEIHRRNQATRMKLLRDCEVMLDKQALAASSQGAAAAGDAGGPPGGGDGAEKEAGYLHKLAAKIVDTLQIKIQNVHVRYQDPVARIAAGLTLRSFTMETLTEEGKAKIGNVSKVLRTELLSVYWDAETTMVDTHAGTFQQAMARLLPETLPMAAQGAQAAQPSGTGGGGSGHAFLLQPSSPTVQLFHVGEPTAVPAGDAQTTVELQYDSLRLSVAREQVHYSRFTKVAPGAVAESRGVGEVLYGTRESRWGRVRAAGSCPPGSRRGHESGGTQEGTKAEARAVLARSLACSLARSPPVLPVR